MFQSNFLAVCISFLTCLSLYLSCTISFLELKEHDIIPDIIKEVPPGVINVTTPSGINMTPGGLLFPPQFNNTPPTVSWKADSDALYTLCFFDYDASVDEKNNIRKQWLHWLVVNIPGKNISLGETLCVFQGWWPCYDSELHRYVYFVYKQPGKMNFQEPLILDTTEKNRSDFNIHEFSKKYNFTSPIALNFFLSGAVDYKYHFS